MSHTVTGWGRLEWSWWPDIADAIEGPWPRHAVLMDLRYWQAVQLQGGRRPGRPTLARRWSWPDRATRCVMRDEAAWSDPIVDDLRPTRVQLSSNSRPTRVQDSGANHAKTQKRSSSPRPTRVQPASNSRPHARSSYEETKDDYEALKALWARLMVERSRHEPGSRGLKLTDDRSRKLRRALSDVAHLGDDPEATLITTLRWVYTSPHIRAKGARSVGALDCMLQPSKTVAYAELSNDNVSKTGALGGDRAWMEATRLIRLGVRPDRWSVDDQRHAAVEAAVLRVGWSEIAGRTTYNEDRLRDQFVSAYLAALQPSAPTRSHGDST